MPAHEGPTVRWEGPCNPGQLHGSRAERAELELRAGGQASAQTFWNKCSLASLERLRSKWSGLSPGNLILLCLLSRLQVTLASPQRWLLRSLSASVLLPLMPALSYLSVQKVGLLSDPRACCWRVSGFLCTQPPLTKPPLQCPRVPW